MSFEDNPANERYQLDQCIDEIKALQAENAALSQQLSAANQDAGRRQGQAETWQQRAEIAEKQLKQQGDRLAAAEILLKHARTWAAYNSSKSADAWYKISINCGNLLEKINRWLPAETADAKGGE